jgi:competence protein ComFC
MNFGTITLSVPGHLPLSMSPVGIAGASFSGYALSSHFKAQTTRSGARFTRRTALAETMYRYRYQNDDSLLHTIAECFASAIRVLFADQRPFDGMLMVPPPVNRSDYNPVVILITEISRLTGIPSLQFAVRDVQETSDRQTGRSGRSFAFSSPDVTAVFAGKRILVIDDIFRSGRSLNRVCSLIKKGGGATAVTVMVGTVMERG